MRQPTGSAGNANGALNERYVFAGQLVLKSLEHADGGAFSNHRRGVVCVRGVGCEHEFRHDKSGGDSAQFRLQDGNVTPGVDGGDGELVVDCRGGVENRAGSVTVERRSESRRGGVALVVDEFVNRRLAGALVFADNRNRRLDFRNDGHVP